MTQHALVHPAGPWYREPWPWILIAGPAIVVVAGFYTLYLAVVSADPLVVDNYYKEGLAINRVLARDHLALQREYRAVVMLNEKRTLVRVQLTGTELPAELRVHFIHPTKAGLDRQVSAKQIQTGLYEASVQLASAGRWDVELGDSQRQWRLTGDWHPSEDRFVLEARPK
jgi:uncharacterized protein